MACHFLHTGQEQIDVCGVIVRNKVQVKLGIDSKWLEKHREWRATDAAERKLDLKSIQSSSPIGVMIDGSLDISRKDQHIVCARTVVDGQAETVVLGIRPSDSGSSSAILNVLLCVVDDMLIDRSRIFILGTDGASPMMGEHTGVGARLQRQLPFLLQNHCYEHRYWFRVFHVSVLLSVVVLKVGAGRFGCVEISALRSLPLQRRPKIYWQLLRQQWIALDKAETNTERVPGSGKED